MTSSMTDVLVGTEHWVARDGHRLHVWRKRREGDTGDTKTTLLVHGGTYSGQTDYDIQVPGKDYSLMDFLASKGHDVFTFAVWGYGRSDRPESGFDVTTEAAVRDTEAVVAAIRELTGVDSVNMLGWSWGGRISALFAGRHPELVQRLIMYAGGAGSGAAPRPAPAESWNVITRENIMERIEQHSVIPDAQEAFIEAALAWDQRSPARMPMGAEGEPQPAAPEEITVPTHIIYGALDGGYRPEQVAGFFAKLGTSDKALTVLPNGGHFLFLQEPRVRFFDAVAQFFG